LHRATTAPVGCSKMATAPKPMWRKHCHPRPMRLGYKVYFHRRFFYLLRTGRRFGDYWIGVNKGGGSRVPSPAKMRIFRMYVSMDLADVSSSGMLHRRSPLGASCLEIPESDGIRSSADGWRVVDDDYGQAVGKLQAKSMMSTAASLFPQ
jgi:hypothetical protein